MAFRVTNISPVARTIDGLGQRIESGATVDLNESNTFDDIVFSAYDELVTRINNDEIRINDGSQDLSKAASLQYVQDTQAKFESQSGGSGAVDSVFGRTGAVTAQSGDYNADQVDETSGRKWFTQAERDDIDDLQTRMIARERGNGPLAGQVFS